MMGYKIAYNSDLIEKFGAIVDPWIKRSNLNTDEIRKLVELRDWLLPMLMNGQVTVT
jgi:type I restriction enzyme S subunit